VAAFDIKMVPAADARTMVPAGMPTPEIIWLTSTPLRLDTPVTIVLPEVTMPVGVTELVVAVALLDITMEVPLAETTATPAGMPAPEISWPGVTPVRLDTDERVELPLLVFPVITKVLAVELEDAVAKFDIVMVLPEDETMVVPVGMPAPVMLWPADAPAMLSAEVMY